MSDRYQTLSATPVGSFLVSSLGLPNPWPLARHTEGQPLVSGRVLVGGDGGARGQVIAAVAAAGGEVVTDTDGRDRLAAVVFDATGIRSSPELATLQQFLTPVMRALEPCARVVVVGTTPAATDGVEAHVAQRALEGFTRSLGKELRRGATAQLVYVLPRAEDRLASTLTFLLSRKSAYVSGQVIRIGAAVQAPAGTGVDPQRPLEGKVALVTGAARGIGAAIARTLHRDGATIVGVDVPRSAGALQDLLDELDGERLVLDITAIDAPQRIARALVEGHGGVDVVVHNAGLTRDRKLANMTDERWTPVIDANLRAPERITAELLDRSVIRPNGRVVVVASISGIAGNPGQTSYATSKAGLIGLVEALAPRAAGADVTVNAVAPGFIETQMTARMPVLLREASRRMNSLSQGGQPVDVAETIAWFADPRSSGVTGNVVRVCGQSLLGA